MSAGSKRKRATDLKFYAVRVGNKPGIYHSWADCLEQVKGVKNAAFKSFPSLTDAEAFLTQNPATVVSRPSAVGQKYYAVQSGRTPGVYTDWPSAQQQITGWSKPKFKSFMTRAEAEAFVRAGTDDGAQQDASKSKSKAPPAKKQKRSSGADTQTLDPNDESLEPGVGPLPPGAEDGFDHRIILNAKTGQIDYRTEAQRNAVKMHATGPADGAMLHIHTDGAARGNGQVGAVAGVGVYFGPQDPRNLSEALPGPRQSNQRAELTAIQRALDLSPRNRDVTIYTDSQYSINCVTKWSDTWRRNNWMTAARKPVENKDLVELILARLDERRALDATTLFQWVRGHADDPGNVAADQLAVQGALQAKRNQASAEPSS